PIDLRSHAAALQGADDLLDVLDRLARRAVEAVDFCDHCGITVVDGRSVDTLGASDDVARDLDRIQYELQEGPCLSVIADKDHVEVPDLAADDRWPNFAERAVAAASLGSVLSAPLFVGPRPLGSLNLYGLRPGPADPHDVQVSLLLAAEASVAAAGATEGEQLRRALGNRDDISMAKGILMERHGIGEREAFDLLRRASRRTNRKVVDLARDFTTGRSPGTDD
ncbi:MAG TPA: GAF and ANTAR domain-containing protein, partial [Aquihabitans sp.]|nr:GAF and ANTAR domain-containing protein [Aquihabitans sp.]